MMNHLLDHTRAVIFDAGNTLALPDWSRISAITEQATSLRFDEADLQHRMCKVLREADESKDFLRDVANKMVPMGWELHRLYGELGLNDSQLEKLLAALLAEHDKYHLWSVLNKEALPLFEQLKRQGMQLAVISNSTDGQVEKLLRNLQIIQHLDLHVDSYRIGLAKPDPKIFLHTVKELGIAPHEAVYVGDSYNTDVVGAQEAGLRAVLFDPYNLQSELNTVRISSLSELTKR